MEDERILLSETLDRIGDAVNDIRQTVGSINTPIEDVAAAVANLGSLHRCETIEQMEQLSANEGDLCLLCDGDLGQDIIPWDDVNINSNIMIFPDEVVLDEIILDGGEWEIISTDNVILEDGVIDIYEDGFYLRINAPGETTVDVSELCVHYHGNDGQHYSLDKENSYYVCWNEHYPLTNNSVIFPYSLWIVASASSKSMDVLGKFIQTKTMQPWDVTTESTLAFFNFSGGHTEEVPSGGGSAYLYDAEGHQMAFVDIVYGPGDVATMTIADNSGEIKYVGEVGSTFLGIDWVLDSGTLYHNNSILCESPIHLEPQSSIEYLQPFFDITSTFKPTNFSLYIYTDGDWKCLGDRTALWYEV